MTEYVLMAIRIHLVSSANQITHVHIRLDVANIIWMLNKALKFKKLQNTKRDRK